MSRLATLRRSIVAALVAGIASAQANSADELTLKLHGAVSLQNIQANLAGIAQAPSRLAGSEGEARAFRWIESTAKRIGATRVRHEPFEVAVPDDRAVGKLTVNGLSTELYPLWPNQLRGSTCNVRGPLLYGGNGTLESLRGKVVKGAIVVLEFNSGSQWRNAAKLGAAAIVMLEAPLASRGDAEAKFASVPLGIPRFFLPLKSSGTVLSNAFQGKVADLVCHQSWVRGQSQNLVIDFDGTENSETINLTSYVDSMSVVPGLNRGVDQASGAAVALEVARIFQSVPHKRRLRLVFSGAHFMALAGAREWVQTRIDKQDDAGLFDLTLDLSSGNSAIGSYARGWFYDYHDEPNNSMQNMSRILRGHVERYAALINVDPPKTLLIDATSNGDGRTWKNNVPGKFALDCEPRIVAGLAALTFITIEDSRPRWDTPFDTTEAVNFANLARQARTITVLMQHLLNDTSAQDSSSDNRVSVPRDGPITMSSMGGFATLDGTVVEYQPQKSFVPDSPIEDSIVWIQPRQKTMLGVRGQIIGFVQKGTAKYAIKGIPPVTAFNQDVPNFINTAAFHIDDRTGNIDYCPSFGIYGAERYPLDFSVRLAKRSSPIVVFRCVATDVYDLVDAQSLTAFQMYLILDATTSGFPEDCFFVFPPFDVRLAAEAEDAQVIFNRAGAKYFFFAGSRSEMRLALLNVPKGKDVAAGFTAPTSGSETFEFPAMATARDLINLNEARMQRFAKYRIVSAGVADIQKQAVSELAAAEQAKSRLDWPDVDRHARAAWALVLRTYPLVRQTANDVVNGVLFYLFLLVPFCYFLERITVGAESVTRQLGVCGLYFLLSFGFLRAIHPAFEIVTNPAMIFVGFIMGSLSLLVVVFVLSKFEGAMRGVQRLQTGVHEVDMNRSSVAMAAFNLGVGNMRRRKARTILTTLTLVVMTFIVLSFTSIVPNVTTSELGNDNECRYGGMLFRNPGLEPMQLSTYRHLANEFEGKATVVRRTAYYGADVGDSSILTLKRGDSTAELRAMAGFDPGESKVLRLQDAILPGGRWFKEGELDAIILPLPIAEKLRIDPRAVGTATVTFGGSSFRVIGLVDPGLLRGVTDLDGDGSMPADFSLSKRFQEESNSAAKAFRSYLRLDPASIFIVPAETSLQLGAGIRSMAVSFADPKQTRPALESLMPRLRMNLYASVTVKGKSELEGRQFSVLQGSKGVGIGLVIMQLLIASIFVLNTMIASVYERTREISIFSSIGLAPNHIAMLFFAESLVYGVLGTVFGYFAAQVAAKILIVTGALPGLTLNFSSTGAVLSAALVMGVVLLSTIYPAMVAGRIASPASMDAGADVVPEGETWTLNLPFSIDTDEAGAVVEYLAEWFRGYEGFTIGDFVTAEIETAHGSGSHSVSAMTWISPYDLGVSQRLSIVAEPTAMAAVSSLQMVIHRESGDPENWVNVNRRFFGSIRRQFLTWRTLSREQRAGYRIAVDSLPATP